MPDRTHDQTHDHHDESHGSTGLYLSVFIALCILTSFSFLTYFDFWRENVSVGVSRAFMMTVSCTKAMLVMLFFMHLKWETNWKWMLTIPASLMSIFLMAMLVPDVGFRMHHASETRMVHAAERPADAVQGKSPSEGHQEEHGLESH